MIGAFLLIAIGAIILLWIDRRSLQETVSRQGKTIRELTGKTNADDEKEKRLLLDDFHYEQIVRQIILEDEYSSFIPEDIVYTKANDRFLQIYGYNYVGDFVIKNEIKPDVDIFCDTFDEYIKDFFPNQKDAALDKIVQKLHLARLEATILFDRWQRFYLIDCHSDGEWFSNSAEETFTIEEFKETTSEAHLDIKKDEETGMLYFEAGNIKGIVSTKEIPMYPLISLFITSDAKEHWILHEEKSAFGAPTRADF